MNEREFVLMPSGLAIPREAAEREIARLRRPKAIDFFAGAGGFSLGAIQAGVEVVAAVEFDPIAAMTYMSNLCRCGEVRMHFIADSDRVSMEKAIEREYERSRSGRFPVAGDGWIAGQPRSMPGVSHMFIGDARELTSQRILDTLGMQPGELDCAFGGPPCQGFSTSGKRNVMDPRSSLVFDFARFVVEIKPKTMVMENVPGMLSMVTADGVPVVDKFCRILEDGGFGGYEAFRRTVAAQAGAVGLLRGKPKTKRKRGSGSVIDVREPEDVVPEDEAA